MMKLTKKDIKNFECDWSGIIVAIPKNKLYYDSELYMYGKYINHNNEVEWHRMDYNKEDSDMFSTCQLNSFKYVFSHFDRFDWYQFNDMRDFCIWYLTDYGYNVEPKFKNTAKISTYEKVNEEIVDKQNTDTVPLKYYQNTTSRAEILGVVMEYVQKVIQVHELSSSHKTDDLSKRKYRRKLKDLIDWVHEPIQK